MGLKAPCLLPRGETVQLQATERICACCPQPTIVALPLPRREVLEYPPVLEPSAATTQAVRNLRVRSATTAQMPSGPTISKLAAQARVTDARVSKLLPPETVMPAPKPVPATTTSKLLAAESRDEMRAAMVMPAPGPPYATRRVTRHGLFGHQLRPHHRRSQFERKQQRTPSFEGVLCETSYRYLVTTDGSSPCTSCHWPDEW